MTYIVLGCMDESCLRAALLMPLQHNYMNIG